MNIFDMPFWAATRFPTKAVENGGRIAEKIGKSYWKEAKLDRDEGGQFRRTGARDSG